MGRLNRIEQIINNTISGYSHVKLYPRGLPRFVDSLLRGTIRFGKRTGNTIAVVNPDNTFPFSTPPQVNDTKFTLAQITPWIVNDCILSLGPEKELHTVDDVVGTTIILNEAVTQTFTTQDKVLLHSYPMLSSIDINVGDTHIIVKSQYPLANGDVFAYLQTETLLESLTEIDVITATLLGTTTSPVYTMLYALDLARPIEKSIISNTMVYLRAYPAYFSSSVRVPNALLTSEPIGPFLIDLLSGNLLEGNAFIETVAIKTLNRTGGYVLGDATSYVTVDKNFVIFNRPVPAHTPMFWDLAEGTMRLTSTNILFLVNPTNNLFCCGTKCIPHVPSNFNWRVTLSATQACSLRFIFYPNPAQEFNLVPGVPQNVIITIPPGADVTQMEINASSNANTCQIQMSDWTPVRDTVEQIQYSLVVRATGIATYQSTGLIIKPYFLGSEYLNTSYDSGTAYNSGKIYF